MSETLAASPLARAIGLALLEFLWQGAAIGASTALILIALRRATAQARYVVACLGLTVMFVAPIVTAASYMRDTRKAPGGTAIIPTTFLGTAPTPTAGATPPVAASEGRRVSFSREWIEAQLPFVVLIWSGGVLVLALRLFRGWVRVSRLRRSARPVAANHWPEALRLMADRLGVTRQLRLIESALVDVPAVIGCLRPAIVVPVSALAGLSPAHLDPILAHELAHVRRGDYLINVVQCVVEILLFYHPAVWWVSRQIRLEREHCCDDLAATLCSDPVAYARALASLEELRAEAPALAMAAGGGELLNRIRRLVEPGSTSGPRLSGGFAMAVMLTVLLLAVSGHMKGMTPGDERLLASVAEPEIDQVAAAPAAAGSRQQDRRIVFVPAEDRRQGTTIPPRVPVVVVPPRDPRVLIVQIDRGKISGDVRDQGGGVIPGARVTVSSPLAADVRTTTTDARGQFLIEDLVSGAYEVAIALAGFRTSRTRVEITPNATVTSSIRLQLGGVAEEIFVRGDPLSPPSANAVAAGQIPTDPRTAADYFDAAKLFYQQGRFAEAEAMTTRALVLLRAAIPPIPESPPAAVPQSTGPTLPLRVGGDIKEPRKIRDVKPVYPAEALAARVEGMVILDAVIAKDGTVKDAVVLRSVPGLDDAALGAVRQWLFTPTLLNNVPVEVTMTVTITFAAR